MKEHWPKITFLVVLVSAIFLAKFLLGDYLSLENFRQNKERLLSVVDRHYFEAVLLFILVYIGTALCLPGALVLTVAGGMMFGILPTVLYVNLGATSGAVLAFLISRSVIGRWIQARFKPQLARFNEEMSRHGKSYLLVLRLLPIAPFFVINYCAGITHIPLKTFLWTTSLGMVPGSMIYAFAGYQLRYLNRLGDLVSWKILLALALLALFSLLPVLSHHLKKAKQ